jgi:hypothetical protein
MDGHAIAAGALGYAGLGMLTSDIGQTRLAEILHARGDARAVPAERHGSVRARSPEAARATRP